MRGPALFAVIVGLVMVCSIQVAHAEPEPTAADVHFWIRAYSVWYSGPNYPYDDLVADVERVARCESHFATDVINNRRLGRFGEVGVGQFMPGPKSIWLATPQARAGYTVTDPEANTAGLVWAISRGLGPKHWACW